MSQRKRQQQKWRTPKSQTTCSPNSRCSAPRSSRKPARAFPRTGSLTRHYHATGVAAGRDRVIAVVAVDVGQGRRARAHGRAIGAGGGLVIGGDRGQGRDHVIGGGDGHVIGARDRAVGRGIGGGLLWRCHWSQVLERCVHVHVHA